MWKIVGKVTIIILNKDRDGAFHNNRIIFARMPYHSLNLLLS